MSVTDVGELLERHETHQLVMKAISRFGGTETFAAAYDRFFRSGLFVWESGEGKSVGDVYAGSLVGHADRLEAAHAVVKEGEPLVIALETGKNEPHKPEVLELLAQGQQTFGYIIAEARAAAARSSTRLSELVEAVHRGGASGLLKDTEYGALCNLIELRVGTTLVTEVTARDAGGRIAATTQRREIGSQ